MNDAAYGRRPQNDSTWVVGRHEVETLLKSGKPVESVVLADSAHGEALSNIREEARRRGVKIRVIPSRAFKRLYGDDGRGVAASVGAFEYTDFDELLDACETNMSAVLVALNHVEDPQNLGAIVRTAEAAGCAGVIIPRERAASMTEGALRASEGAATHLPVARVVNLGEALRKAKKRGYWVIGLDGAAPKRYSDVQYTGRIILTAGGENAGLGKVVASECDELVSIPLFGKTPSLNVSVSVGIALFEMLRQKHFNLSLQAAGHVR